MRASRWLLVLLLAAALPIAACGSGLQRSCEECTNHEDCEPPLTCQLFYDSANNSRSLCGDTNPDMLCPNPDR